MKDYPALTKVAGNWTLEQAERGSHLRQCERELPRFIRWYHASEWYGKVAILYAAQIYCLQYSHLPKRFTFIQTLTQLYEQNVLTLVREYPPHLSYRRWFQILPFRRTRAPPLPAS